MDDGRWMMEDEKKPLSAGNNTFRKTLHPDIFHPQSSIFHLRRSSP
jgi:hypothetical protein